MISVRGSCSSWKANVVEPTSASTRAIGRIKPPWKSALCLGLAHTGDKRDHLSGKGNAVLGHAPLSDRGPIAAGIGRVKYLPALGRIDQAPIYNDGSDALRISYVRQRISIQKVEISKLALFDGA